MNTYPTTLAATNDQLRARGVESVVYENVEFSGGLEGRLTVGVEHEAIYIGKANSYPRFTYARARGGRIGLDREQAIKLIQGHRGEITVRL